MSKINNDESSLPANNAGSNPGNRYRPDIPIFLCLIPIISGINYYLTYSNVRLNGFFALTFCLDTLQGYAAWWAVRRIIIYLDKILPFEVHFGRRLLVQLFTTTLTGLIIIASLTEIASFIAKGRPAPISFYSIDLVIISIWFFVINGIYMVLYYVGLSRRIYQKGEATPSRPASLIARVGRETVRIDPDQISGLFVDDNYVVAVTAAGKKHYLDQSLDKLERILSTDDFFRVNRQYILHRRIISGFRRLDNGKLAVLLVKAEWLPPEVAMSRTRAAMFKEWFHVSE